MARLRRQGEAEAARAMLAGFVRAAREAGLAPVPLRARGVSGGRRRVRTTSSGWYLRRNHSIAVDVEGRYLVLTVPLPWYAGLRPVQVPASEPPLVVGRGGGDGVAIDLADLLRHRLEAGPDF